MLRMEHFMHDVDEKRWCGIGCSRREGAMLLHKDRLPTVCVGQVVWICCAVVGRLMYGASADAHGELCKEQVWFGHDKFGYGGSQGVPRLVNQGECGRHECFVQSIEQELVRGVQESLLSWKVKRKTFSTRTDVSTNNPIWKFTRRREWVEQDVR